MSDDKEEDAPGSKILRGGFADRESQGATRRVTALPHLIAKSRRPDQPEAEVEEGSLEETTFNPTDDLFDGELDDDFFDELFESE